MEVNDFEFKKNFVETIERHKKLQFARKGCLISTFLPEEEHIANSVKIPPLEEIDFRKDVLLLPKLLCDREEKLYRYRSDYPDDSIPVLALRYGSGIFAGMILGTLRFGANTSWIEPVGKTIEETINFPWKKDNEFIDIALSGFRYATKRMKNKCYVYLSGYHSPLELAFILRGSEFFLDVYSCPDKVHTLIQQCDKALKWIYQLLEDNVRNENYGNIAGFLWMERCLPFLSEDAAGLLSPQHYKEFGVPYTDEVFRRFGGGFLHVHTQSYHQMENISSMEHLTTYNWRPDPNTPEAISILEKLIDGARKKIVVIVADPQSIQQKVDLLSQGRFFLLCYCKNRNEQNFIVDFVKEKLQIK
ncbi:MAG TPA: uroporphyrinogen decarboxylase family protein [bacterium]|nr:uroporphyrinogen decarboxylase family protein [bacterium]